MVRVLLAVHGEGNGHMTRCKAILEHWANCHDVVVAADGRAYNYLRPHTKSIERVSSLHLGYRNNKISSSKTLWINVLNLPDLIRSMFRLHRLIKEFRPQVMVNDFSAIASYIGRLHRLPIITVDNNQLVAVSKMNLPNGWSWAHWKANLAIRLMVPWANFRLIPSFTFPQVVKKHVELVPPILRKEIRSLKSRRGDYVLIYQTSSSNKQLLDVIKNIDQRFIVYGFNKDRQLGNVTLKRFSEGGFLKDLASAKAVIMNGGFSLMTECMYLEKPILSIPVKGQIEQMINARELERQGLGSASEDNDLAKIVHFIRSLKSPKRIPDFDYDLAFRRLDEKIKQLTS